MSGLSYLLRLRWLALAGQAITVVATDRLLSIPVPTALLLSLVALGLLTNLGLELWVRGRRAGHGLIAATMLFDGALLTALLAFSGGASNPFSTLYLVNVCLAAVLLPGRWAFAVGAASLAMFGLLFALPHAHADIMQFHLAGMWVAFLVAAAFIVVFVRKIRVELERAQERRTREERLASLATLAAGAAHELATPLATVAVAVTEASEALAAGGPAATVQEDLHLARAQIERCRRILTRMASAAGEPAGEALATADLAGCARDAIALVPGGDGIQLEVVSPAAARVPRDALVAALAGLVKNAVEAQPATAQVVVRVGGEGRARLEVIDAGPGMSAELLARVGEPFFTTKGATGMGLGVFVAQELARHLGGRVVLISTPGQGTTARMDLPEAS